MRLTQRGWAAVPTGADPPLDHRPTCRS